MCLRIAVFGRMLSRAVPPEWLGILYARERRALETAIALESPEVLEAQWTYEFAWVALATGLPSAVVVRDNAHRVLALEPTPFRAVRFSMDWWTRRRAATLIANSEYTCSVLGRRGAGRTNVVENFVGETVTAVAAEPKPSEQSPYFVTVVNGFSPLKNLESALRGYAVLRRKRVDSGFLFVGRDCEPGGPLYRFAHARGLAAGVTFIGAKSYPETLRLIRDATALLHPGREESFGNAVLEAMALSTPVVAGASSGNIPHLLRGGSCGILVDITNADAIAAGLKVLVEDEQLRHQLISAAKFEADTTYSVDRCVRLHEGILRSLKKGG